MSALRPAVLALAVCAAVVAQAAVFRYVSVEGVVPDLVMLVVIAAALSRGSTYAAAAGFAAGLLLDLAPPADHVAGRWALALLVVGYLAGRVRTDARANPLLAVALVAAMSFVATSVYAFTGFVLDDGALPVDLTLRVLLIGVLWDVMLAPFLLPVLTRLVDSAGPGADPDRVRAVPAYRVR